MMAFCKHRVMDKCKKDGRPCIFSEKCFEPEEKKLQTNADCIRNMSDEELAEYLATLMADTRNGVDYSTDEDRWFNWLQQPAKECE